MSDPVREIQLSLGTVRYTVRRSSRARRMILRYHDARGFEVVLPPGAPSREVEPFLWSMESWIARVLARRERPAATPLPTGLYDGGVLPFLGSTLGLRIEGVSGGNTIRLDDLTRVVHARIDLDDPLPIEALVEEWYRYAARELLPERVGRYAGALGVRHGRITVKDTRTRWGSCSSKGNLNFSWRLLLAPDEVFDYVVAHEVAHLVELNHSPRFWRTLASLYPDYRVHQAWLKRHGPALAAWPENLTPTPLLRGEGRSD